MTRKRFVKLMMSCGMSRNDAQKACTGVPREFAKHPEWGRFCYADFWGELHDYLLARALSKLASKVAQEERHDRS